jgi:hypothetical protein
MMNKREMLRRSIANLPIKINPDQSNSGEAIGVMRLWTHKMPLRHQGVLVTSIRGCDVSTKEDSSKHLTRMIRRAILNPADWRETQNKAGFFGFNPKTLEAELIHFLHSLDQYPLHYITHLMHGCEVIGYKHPDIFFKLFFNLMYEMMVHTLHLHPESENQMDARLTEDRVALGTTESNFPDVPRKPVPAPPAANRASYHAS